MIKIKVKHIRPKKKNDLTESVFVDLLNTAVDNLAKSIKKDTKGMKCSECKTNNSTLIIEAHRIKKIKVVKSGFCCRNFADSIKIKQ